MSGSPFGRVRAAVAKLERSAGGRGSTSGLLRVTILDDSTAKGKGVDRLFEAFEATIDDLPAVMREAIPEIRKAHAETFSTEGSAGRGKWSPLADRTLEERERLGFPPGPILVRTGRLRAHVLAAPATITRRPGFVELRIEPAAVVDGVPKYAANALGTSRIPARPMVAIGPASANRVTSTIQRALRARAQANGLR